MKRTTLLLTALMAVTLATVTFAAPEDDKAPRPRRGPGEMSLLPPRLMDDLALTADQKAKIADLSAKFDKERDTWLAANKPDENLRKEMRAARDADDQAKLNELRGKMRQHRQPLLDLRKTYMDQVRALLTPDQIKTLDEARDRARERFDRPEAKPKPAK